MTDKEFGKWCVKNNMFSDCNIFINYEQFAPELAEYYPLPSLKELMKKLPKKIKYKCEIYTLVIYTITSDNYYLDYNHPAFGGLFLGFEGPLKSSIFSEVIRKTIIKLKELELLI